jgi:hypothetical protein
MGTWSPEIDLDVRESDKGGANNPIGNFIICTLCLILKLLTYQMKMGKHVVCMEIRKF